MFKKFYIKKNFNYNSLIYYLKFIKLSILKKKYIKYFLISKKSNNNFKKLKFIQINKFKTLNNYTKKILINKNLIFSLNYSKFFTKQKKFKNFNNKLKNIKKRFLRKQINYIKDKRLSKKLLIKKALKKLNFKKIISNKKIKRIVYIKFKNAILRRKKIFLAKNLKFNNARLLNKKKKVCSLKLKKTNFKRERPRFFLKKKQNDNKIICKNLKYKYYFKNNLIFIKKLFMIFVNKGLKCKVINMFIYFLNYINLKFLKKKLFNIKKLLKRNIKKKYLFKKNNKKLYFNLYVHQVKKKIFPIFNNLSFSKKGEKIFLPWVLFNNRKKYKKLSTICCSWIKKSVSLRKEKTLFLKILSEIESIRKNSSNSILLKKQYYISFYKNKYFIKFLKKKNWI